MKQLPLFSNTRKNVFIRFPWFMLAVVMFCLCIGLVNLYSATYKFDAATSSVLFRSQLLWVSIGLGLLFAVLWMDMHFFYEYAFVLYAFSLLLLCLVFFLGKSVAGQQNWIVVAGFSFQPSEFAKLAFILALSKIFSKQEALQNFNFPQFIKGILLLVLPMGLILAQKDLGSSVFFLLLFLTLGFFLPFKMKSLIVLIIFACGIFIGLYHYGLKPYQKERIQIFMHPEKDPRGSGYHLMQSKIAVGSGGFLGRGYLKGTMNKLKFLPERHTDFIFPVLAEEWGLLGALFALGMILLFLLLGLDVAYESKDVFCALVSIGVVGLFFWHFVINLGGVLGLLPLTGVPLPFFSYGGSSVVTMLLAVGLLLNIRMRRYMF